MRLLLRLPGSVLRGDPKAIPWWVSIAYLEFDRDEFVCAPRGLGWICWLRRYWKMALFLPLNRARLWFVLPGVRWTEGHFALPWSECWKAELTGAFEAGMKIGEGEGRKKALRELEEYLLKRSLERRVGAS